MMISSPSKWSKSQDMTRVSKSEKSHRKSHQSLLLETQTFEERRTP
jgi:hypothetical protein